MAVQQPGQPPYEAPVTDANGKMDLVWYQWCVMMWKKLGAGSALSLAWGSITGTLSAQTDLQTALNAKVTANAAITPGTHTKITYDAKGLVDSGTDLVAGDIPNIAESQVTNLVSDLAGKQAALGYTPENVANKTTDGTLAANSDTLYPSEKAVKTYVDGHSSAVPTGTGFRHVTSGVEDGAAVTETGSGSVVRASAPTLTNPVVGTQSPADNSTKAASTAYADAAAAAVSTGGTVTHTAGTLDAHKVVIGNGTADIKVIATGTAGQYVRSGGASADPAMASIAESEVTNLVSDLALKAPLASPALTGVPTAPTAPSGTSTTQLATCQFVSTSAGSGSLAPSRTSITVTTASLADAAAERGTVVVAKSALVVQVVCDRFAWVRLYSSAAARDADTTRLITADPVWGTQHGVILDFYADRSGYLTFNLSPAVVGSDLDGGGTNLYYSITNKSGATHTVAVTFYFVPMEN